MLPSMIANGSFHVPIPCHMWNGKLCIGDLQESLSLGEITASITQTNMVMNQTLKGTCNEGNETIKQIELISLLVG